MDHAREYARLARRRHDLEAKLRQVKAAMEGIKEKAAKQIGPDEVLRSHGMELQVQSDSRVKFDADTSGLVSAVKRSRKPELLSVNYPAVIAYAKTKGQDGLPAALARVLRVEPDTQISARRRRRRKGAA